MENTLVQPSTSTVNVMSSQMLLAHWLGHRNVTRNVIEAFPEKEFFHHTVGGMRPFAEMVAEMLHMAVPIVQGAATRIWPTLDEKLNGSTKEEILKEWDESTEQIIALWPQISEERFAEVDVAFGMYEGPVRDTIMYGIDNEIHHRGQGYVYLRTLGIQPPFFWERG